MLANISEHPLFLLVLGAILTGLVLPSITRRWQNYQKELDLKTDLVAEMSASLMTILMTFEFSLLHTSDGAEIGNKGDSELTEKSKEWKIWSCVIGSKLHAYFPDDPLHKKWTSFSKEVSLFCETATKDNWSKEKEPLLSTKAKLIKQVLNQKIDLLK